MPFIPLERYPEFKVLQENKHTLIEEMEKIRNQTWKQWGSDATGPDGKAMFLTEGGDWTTFPVYVGSLRIYKSLPFASQMPQGMLQMLTDKMKQTFPKTTELLSGLKRINYVGYSRLKGHSSLDTHRHYNEGSLILHMGLTIPPGDTCALKVGEDTHLWHKSGDMIIFNDNNYHSAWNHSDQERIIFYIDFTCDDPKEGLAT